MSGPGALLAHMAPSYKLEKVAPSSRQPCVGAHGLANRISAPIQSLSPRPGALMQSTKCTKICGSPS